MKHRCWFYYPGPDARFCIDFYGDWEAVNTAAERYARAIGACFDYSEEFE